MPNRRYFKLTTGIHDFQMAKPLHGCTKFRISQLNYIHSGITSSSEIVHIKIGDYVSCYDETNSLYYTIAFVCDASASVSYTPVHILEDLWYDLGQTGVSEINFETRIDGNVVSNISGQNIYIELEFR